MFHKKGRMTKEEDGTGTGMSPNVLSVQRPLQNTASACQPACIQFMNIHILYLAGPPAPNSNNNMRKVHWKNLNLFHIYMCKLKEISGSHRTFEHNSEVGRSTAYHITFQLDHQFLNFLRVFLKNNNKTIYFQILNNSLIFDMHTSNNMLK